MNNRYQQTLKYKTIKAFLNATRSMLEQFPLQQTETMYTRVSQLETQLEQAYQSRDSKRLFQVSEQIDTLALDLLDYLDMMNLGNASSSSLQA